MRVSAGYFDGETYELLKLSKEQWGLVTGPIQAAPFCTVSAEDEIARQVKSQAAQAEFRKFE